MQNLTMQTHTTQQTLTRHPFHPIRLTKNLPQKSRSHLADAALELRADRVDDEERDAVALENLVRGLDNLLDGLVQVHLGGDRVGDGQQRAVPLQQPKNLAKEKALARPGLANKQT
jgi:hypothetical protein